MKVAVISDIHANLQALEAGLASIAEREVDEIWCLGDVIGYGADPDACVALVAEKAQICLAGNHDLAVLGELDVNAFSPAAAAAVRWTQNVIGDESLRYLRRLEPWNTPETGDIAMYHASPRDPIWEYVLWPDQAADCLSRQERRVSCVGHSHVALHFHLLANGDVGATVESDRHPMAVRSDVVATAADENSSDPLDFSRGRWLLNPGSIGQPRDGDPRAAWLEIDTESCLATWHRVEYDIDAAAAAITEAGLPGQLASRLFSGK